MESLASPIRIPVARATVLHYGLVAGHVLTFAGLVFIFPFGMHTALLMALVTVSLGLEVYTVGLPHRRWKALLLGRNDEWTLFTTGGEPISARLLTGVFVSTRLVIVRLKPSAGRPLQIVLTPANTPPDAFRRLRVRLRYPLASGVGRNSGYA